MSLLGTKLRNLCDLGAQASCLHLAYSNMKRASKHITVLFLYTLLTCLLLYPLPAKFSTGLLEAQSGDPLMQIWVVQWNIHKLTSSLSHYFDANIFYPYPNTFAYHDHMFGLGLLGFPVYLLTHNPILTYNIVFLFSFVTSGFGMYLLARYLTNNTFAGLIAGIIFAFSPFMFSHLSHLQIISAGGIPLTFLYVHKFFNGEKFKHLLLFTLFYLLQILANGHYALYLTLFLGLYIIYYAVSRKRYYKSW